jgi:hypothetical protein
MTTRQIIIASVYVGLVAAAYATAAQERPTEAYARAIITASGLGAFHALAWLMLKQHKHKTLVWCANNIHLVMLIMALCAAVIVVLMLCF